MTRERVHRERRHKEMTRWAATSLLLFGLMACGEVSTESTRGSTEPVVAPTTTEPDDTRPAEDLRPLSESEQETLDTAIADLAGRTEDDPGEIEVVSFDRITWNDGSLGCPEPGMMYTQALVDGWRIQLERDGVIYPYHAGSDGEPFLCESPSLKPGPDPSLSPPGDTER